MYNFLGIEAQKLVSPEHSNPNPAKTRTPSCVQFTEEFTRAGSERLRRVDWADTELYVDNQDVVAKVR